MKSPLIHYNIFYHRDFSLVHLEVSGTSLTFYFGCTYPLCLIHCIACSFNLNWRFSNFFVSVLGSSVNTNTQLTNTQYLKKILSNSAIWNRHKIQFRKSSKWFLINNVFPTLMCVRCTCIMYLCVEWMNEFCEIAKHCLAGRFNIISHSNNIHDDVLE